MKQHHKKNPHNLIKAILYIFVVIAFLYFILPYLLPIKLKTINNSSVILDRNQNKIWEIIHDGVHRHQWVELNKYPDFFKASIITIEDKHFWTHNGIDRSALIRAAIQNSKSDSIVQWASTITSQIARNQLRLNAPRTRPRKLFEFFYAYILDSRYTKKELLSYYLNTMPMWYLNYGMESASQRYFDKSVFQLSKAQQIALITIAKNPVRYDPYKKISNFETRYTALAKILLSWEKIDINWLWRLREHYILQPYLTDFIKKELSKADRKYIINTTIDDNISRDIKKIADQTIYKLQWKNVSDYWVLVIDRKSSELRVMLWWMFYDGKAWQVNSTTSINQPWSAVKPFTYALAFQDLWLRPSDVIVDEPVQFQSLLWYAYTPQNFSMKYQWEVTIASALAQSLNVPAVKIANKLWAEKILDFYHKIWLTSLNQPADFYGLAITLWVWEVSLREMARAYGIFAHHGELCNIVIFQWQKTVCKNVINWKYTDMVVEILSNRYNKMPSFPLFSNLDFPDRNVFLKSWTSRSFSDNWVIWFTDDYIIAVRVGNKDWANMKWVSWVSWAWDIFNNIVYYLQPSTQQPNYLPPTVHQTLAYLNITKPLPDSIFQIDSTISKNLQWIKFQYNTNIAHNSNIRELNNQRVNDLWIPQIWNYTLNLKLFSWNILVWKSSVKFEVR